MTRPCANNIWLTFALLILGLCGCDKSTQPLPLLAAEQIPTELQKAFGKALAARALLSINGLLQTAQAQGDQKAAEVLKFQQRNR